MKTHLLKSFKKNYKKRISPHASLEKQFEERYLLFLEDSTNPILKDHPLKGSMKGLRSFSITGDKRVVYYTEDDTVYFIDIGTHNQVY